jgi:hypothetical protein
MAFEANNSSLGSNHLRQPEPAERWNAEKWVQYLSAFDFSAIKDFAVMTKRGTDWLPIARDSEILGIETGHLLAGIPSSPIDMSCTPRAFTAT